MASFQFPATPDDLDTVVNPITGSTYQWRADLSKWVLTRQPETTGSDLIWEGDSPPDPIGDYKLWYSTDTLELYFYYCDANGVCAWLPTSVPIQVLEDLNAFAAQAEVDIDQLQYKQQLLQNTVDQLYRVSLAPPAISEHYLRYTGSGSELGNGMYQLSSSILIYKNNTSGIELPELKVGDQFAVIKFDGNVVRVEVIQRKGLIGGYFQFNVNSLTPDITPGTAEAANVQPINLVLY